MLVFVVDFLGFGEIMFFGIHGKVFATEKKERYRDFKVWLED